MHEMRAESDLTAGTPLVWHVLRKDLSATMCGRLTPNADPWCQISGDITERYCEPCLTMFRLEAGRPL